MSDDSARVPAGHAIHAYGGTVDPGVRRTRSGVIVASFGVGGDDDLRELESLAEGVTAYLEHGAAGAIRFSRTGGPVAALFAPAPLPPAVETSVVVWFAGRDALRDLLAQPDGVEDLLDAIEGTDAERHVFVVDDDWTGGAAPLEFLASNDVLVLQVAPRAPFLIEVERPDGVIAALSAQPRTITGEASSAPRQLARSPRLTRALAELLDGTGSIAEVHRVLEERTAPLLVFVQDGGLPTMTWSEEAQAIPAFADLPSIARAARETGRTDAAIGGMSATDLLATTRAQGVKLALGVYGDAGVRYVVI